MVKYCSEQCNSTLWADMFTFTSDMFGFRFLCLSSNHWESLVHLKSSHSKNQELYHVIYKDASSVKYSVKPSHHAEVDFGAVDGQSGYFSFSVWAFGTARLPQPHENSHLSYTSVWLDRIKL